MTDRVFSGVQPSGALHLGNYLGAIRQFVDLQNTAECYYCIVDLHAITVYQDPAELRQSVLEVAAAYIASGVDPKRSTIFQQSTVPEHTEMAWLLNCVARVGWLNRMPQYKEKTEHLGMNSEGPSVGLYDYPVLQTADILLYGADKVPVGSDQLHHLELARDIAQKFNTDYDEPNHFILPEAVLMDAGARVMSLIDGTKKMSKSEESDPSRINLKDTNDVIAHKIKRATSDSELFPEEYGNLDHRPEARNLLGIYAACRDISPVRALEEFAGRGYGALKPALTDAIIERVEPIRDEMSRLLGDTFYLREILLDGGFAARRQASSVLGQTKYVMGLGSTIRGGSL
jgi:tryptophanyl-tRNA synthetase